VFQVVHLPTIVLVFQIELLLQLVNFDLKFDAAFSLEIARFEQLKLQRVALLAQSISFFS